METVKQHRSSNSLYLSIRSPTRSLAGWLQRRLLCEQTDGGVGSRGEDPGLRGVKGDIQDSEVVSDHMTSQDLDWDDQGVLEQITGEKEQGAVSVCV